MTDRRFVRRILVPLAAGGALLVLIAVHSAPHTPTSRPSRPATQVTVSTTGTGP